VQTRLLTLLGTGAILLGSAVPEFWNAKDPASWTHADAEQMMSSSPWAKQKSMPISERPAVSYVDGDPSVNATSPPSAQLGNLTPARNRRIGNSDVYFFRFPKTALPLTPSDEEALFKLTMGKMNLNQKFRLSEMTYQGRLAL
jgi:hypothetical protein